MTSRVVGKESRVAVRMKDLMENIITARGVVTYLVDALEHVALA